MPGPGKAVALVWHVASADVVGEMTLRGHRGNRVGRPRSRRVTSSLRPAGRRRLPKCERLESRRLLAGDLIAQWLADDLAAEQAEGGTIVGWTDAVSGIEATAAGTPQLIEDGLGGRAVVRFDPVDGTDSFPIGMASNPITDAEDFSVLVVFQTSSQDLVGATDDWFQNTGLVDANQSGIGRDWGLTLNQAGQLSTGMSGGLGSKPTNVYSASMGLNDGRGHIAIVTRQAETLSLYVDGGTADSLSDADSQPRGRLDLTFGDLATGELPYDGDIAQVRIYRGALTPAEVAEVHDELHAYYNNAPPVAVDDRYSASEDQLLLFIPAGSGILQNDSDADGDALSASLVDGPQHGSLTLGSDGSFVYDSNDDFFGTDSFTYVASDFRPSAVATVTIDVLAEYDAPRTTADAYTSPPDQRLVVDASQGVLANDGNPDQVTFSAVLEEDVDAGMLMLYGDGSFDYDPRRFLRENFVYVSRQ